VKGFKLPGGQLSHTIWGRGYHIDKQEAIFVSIGNLCDSSVRFTYGNGRYNSRGGVHWGCSHVGRWRYRRDWNAPRGSACAELWAKNWRIKVATQCHYIHG
jgi:hypothetical protein